MFFSTFALRWPDRQTDRRADGPAGLLVLRLGGGYYVRPTGINGFNLIVHRTATGLNKTIISRPRTAQQQGATLFVGLIRLTRAATTTGRTLSIPSSRLDKRFSGQLVARHPFIVNTIGCVRANVRPVITLRTHLAVSIRV